MTSTWLARLAVLALLVAAPARAEQVVLAPRYQPGDSYVLSLDRSTDTDALSRGATPRASGEDVRLRYRAAVVVLEVDGQGRALRERHERVQLSFERGEESGDLFRSGAGYEIRRRRDGRVELFAGDAAEQRLERKIETLVADVLEGQLEYTLLPALVEPGRPVEVGESWTLDAALARRVLGARGLRVIDFGEPATARLERAADAPEVLVVLYSIPVAWLELAKMPPNARAGDSEGRLEGTIRLSGDPRALSHTSTLRWRMNGVVMKTGVARAFPWSLESSHETAQRTQVLGRAVVSGL